MIIDRSKYKEADPNKFLMFANPNQKGIFPVLSGRLAYLCQDKGETLTITRGFVTSAEQKAAGDALLAEHSDYYRDSAGAVRKKTNGKITDNDPMMASAPGDSNHEFKQAADIPNDKWLRSMTNSQLEPYGLLKPMSYEPWHVQIIETKGMSKYQIKGIGTMDKYDIIAFQKAYGLTADGIPGKNTAETAERVKCVCDYIIEQNKILYPPAPQMATVEYLHVGMTEIIKADPFDLRAAIMNAKPSDIIKMHSTFINFNYFNPDGSVSGWLASEGKILHERHTDSQYDKPKGTYIVFKNHSVFSGWKTDAEMQAIRDQIWFCCQGFNLFPSGMTVSQGIAAEGYSYSGVGYAANRVMLGYDGKQAVMVGRPATTAERAQATAQDARVNCKGNMISGDAGHPGTFGYDGNILMRMLDSQGKETTIHAIVYVNT